MKVLALDLATHTGWAYWDGSRVESGVQVFDVKRGESPGMRFIRFNRWLDPFGPPSPCAVELMVYEQTHHRGGAATEIAAGFATRVQEFCAHHGIEHQATHSATLKKWTTGKGNAKKPDMIAAVSARWKPVTDDNEADAVALLHYSLAELVPSGR